MALRQTTRVLMARGYKMLLITGVTSSNPYDWIKREGLKRKPPWSRRCVVCRAGGKPR